MFFTTFDTVVFAVDTQLTKIAPGAPEYTVYFGVCVRVCFEALGPTPSSTVSVTTLFNISEDELVCLALLGLMFFFHC